MTTMAAPIGNKFGYKNENSGRPITWTKEIIEKEAELFIEWAQRDDALVLREFAPLRGYPHLYLYRWKDENEAFCYAFQFAQSLIGSRREKYVLEKSVSRDLPMYFEELHAFETKEADADVERKTRVSKSEAKALEEERQKVIEEVQRSKKAPQ